jgi:hypothetical protein
VTCPTGQASHAAEHEKERKVMITIAQILSLFMTFAFGFLAAFSDNAFMQVYCVFAFAVMGVASITLLFVGD